MEAPCRIASLPTSGASVTGTHLSPSMEKLGRWQGLHTRHAARTKHGHKVSNCSNSGRFGGLGCYQQRTIARRLVLPPPPALAKPRCSLEGGSYKGEPSAASRYSSAVLFMLPLAEGMYRLLLAVVQCCWQRVLDLWMWCLVQQDNLRCVLAASSRTAAKGAIEELAACDHVLQWCHKLYLGLHELYTHLGQLSQLQLLAIPCAWPFLPTTIVVTPSILWDLFTAVSMLLIFQVAASRTSEWGELSEPAGMMHGSRLVLVSFFCTALLRVSWAPLYSISGMLPKLYHLCAVLLTSSTVFLCTAVIGKVLFSRLDSMKSALEELVAGTRGVVLFSRTLLYLDWLLGMAGPSPLLQKLLLMVKFFCYATAVEFLSSSIDTYLVENK